MQESLGLRHQVLERLVPTYCASGGAAAGDAVMVAGRADAAAGAADAGHRASAAMHRAALAADIVLHSRSGAQPHSHWSTSRAVEIIASPCREHLSIGASSREASS